MLVRPRRFPSAGQSAHHDHFAVLFGFGRFGSANEGTRIHMADELVTGQRMETRLGLAKVNFHVLVLGENVGE